MSAREMRGSLGNGRPSTRTWATKKEAEQQPPSICSPGELEPSDLLDLVLVMGYLLVKVVGWSTTDIGHI